MITNDHHDGDPNRHFVQPGRREQRASSGEILPPGS